MMKINIIIILIVNASILSANGYPFQYFIKPIKAEIIHFPGVKYENYHVAVPDSIASLFCTNCVQTPGCPFNYYRIQAMLPLNSEEWIINKSSLRRNRKIKKHPFYPVAKMFIACKKGRFRKLIRQYTKEMRPDVRLQFKNDTIRNMVKNVYYPVEKLVVPLVFKYDEGFFVITTNFKENIIMPYYVIESKRRMRLTSVTDTSGILSDVLNLVSYYNPGDMIVPADMDRDGILNLNDNCPCDMNTNQQDEDQDQIGDICDNCPSIPNKEQTDYDQDGIGDACDNCLQNYNPGQEDWDENGKGDRCD